MTSLPQPGQPVRGSRTGKPLMVLLDLLGRRWALGVVWNVCEHGPLSFRDLRARCDGVSPSVLNTRLKELRSAGFIERAPDGYIATPRCIELFDMLKPLKPWAHRWAEDLSGKS